MGTGDWGLATREAVAVDTAVTILNVDDEEVGLYAKSRLLRYSGYHVLEAATGAETIRLAQRRPNVIVLDMNLPDMSGIEICRYLKAEPATAVIPILLISATFVDSRWHAAGLESGADGYLIEPVEPMVFLATVRALLRTQQAEAALHQARDELELRVAERTAALAEANRALQGEILERKRAEEEARRQAAHAATLARVAASFNARLALPRVLEVVCQETARLLHVPATAVALYDRSSQRYILAATHGLPAYLEEMGPPLHRAAFDQYRERLGPVRTVADMQQLPDLANAALYAKADIRSVASADMEYEDETIGILAVLSMGEIRTFSEQELALLKGVADQAALALTNARLFEEVQTGHERSRQMAQRLVSVQEEERQRLSRELHDSASQLLTALQINLMLAGESLAIEDDEARQNIDEAQELARTAYDEIRAVSHALRPPALETLGIDQTLASLCRDFGRHTGLDIDYRGDELPPLPDMVAISFYRFLQEGLANVAKHADADRVWVQLDYEDDALSLTITDNGAGFEMVNVYSAGQPQQGVGLQGMRERFELLGGQLEIESRPGEGTRLVGWCPMRPDSGKQR